MRYLAKRAAASLLQLLVVSWLAWGLFRWTPGDYWSGEAGDPQRRAESLSAWRAQAATSYGSWVAGALQGDLGVSLAYRLPVAGLLAPRLATTLRLASTAWALAWGLALCAAALSRSRSMQAGAAVLALLPEAITGSALLWWAASQGASLDAFWLPLVILTLAVAPVIYLHAARSFHAARQARFVRLAEQRGVKSIALWLWYVWPAAAHPLLALAGTTAAGVLGSSLVVEAITGRAGIGPLFLEAFQRRDYPIVQAVLLLLAAVLTSVNLVADLALYRLDPRIRVSA